MYSSQCVMIDENRGFVSDRIFKFCDFYFFTSLRPLDCCALNIVEYIYIFIYISISLLIKWCTAHNVLYCT